MRLCSLLGAMLAVAISAGAASQPAVIDANATPRPFSSDEYGQMLACTLERHPDETRRYAQYHLLRRDVQTPAQNESDPDSGLLMPALNGCFEMRSDEPMPFDLDRLIADWGSAYGVAPNAPVRDMPSLAACSVKHNAGFARAYMQFPFDGSERSIRSRRMLMQSLVTPPCVGTGSMAIDHTELRRLIALEFAAQQAAD